MAKRVFTVLCIDGGGVRGVIPARLLQEIEERTGKPVAELFDLVAGTSTGAILAAGVTAPDPKNPKKPKLTAKDMLELYHNHAADIFPNSRYKLLMHLAPGTNGFYDPEPFEKTLEKYMGDVKLKDTMTHIMIPATDIKQFKPVWIKHLKGQKDKKHWGTMLLRDAVRASATPPTIFPVRYVHTTPNEKIPDAKDRHAFIDGTFFGGHMARRAYAEAKKIAPEDAEIVVVQLGTGYVASNSTPDEFNKKSLIDMVTTKSDGPSILSMSFSMFTHDVIGLLKEEIGGNMFEFDGKINTDDPDKPSDSIVDASKENLENLEKFAEKIIDNNEDSLQRLCKMLKHKTYVEDLHNESAKALHEINKELSNTKTVKQLNRLYTKIVEYSCDIPEDFEVSEEDRPLLEKAQKLTERHKTQLDRIYQAQKDEMQSDKLSIFKRWGRAFTNSRKEKEAQDKKPSNDNYTPYNSHGKKKNNNGPKR